MRLSSLSLASIVLFGTACADIQGPGQEEIPAEQVLSFVTASTPSIVMQLGDSLQLGLSATSIVETEIPILNPEEITWSSADPEQVEVDSTGMVRARRLTVSNVNVIASWQHNTITKSDTVPVIVTADRYDITSIRLVVVDSNKVGGGPLIGVPPRVRIDGMVGSDVAFEGIYMHVSVPKQINIAFGRSLGDAGEDVFLIDNPNYWTGKFNVVAAGTVYGVPVADSVEWTALHVFVFQTSLGENLETGDVSDFYYSDDLGPLSIFQQACGLYVIMNLSSQPVDIIWDDSTAASDCGPDLNGLESLIVEGNKHNLGQYEMVAWKFSEIGKKHTWRARLAGSEVFLPRATGSLEVRLPAE